MARHRRDHEPESGLPPAPIRRRTIRGRLVRILALPLIAVVVLLTVVVVDDTNAYRTARDINRAVGLLLEMGNLVHALQEERGAVAGLLGGDVSFRSEVDRSRSLVDDERAILDRLAAGPDSIAVRPALAGVAGLADLRSKVDATQITRAVAFDAYTKHITELASLDVGVDRSPDEALRRGVNSLQALNDVKEYVAQERAFLNGVFAAGGFAAGEYRTFASIYTEEQAALARYRRYATPVLAELVARALDTGAAREAAFFERRALAAIDKPFVVSPQSWWSAHTTVLDDLRAAEVAVGADVSSQASALQTSATIRLAGLGVLAGLSVLGASALLVAASRSITRPLAALAAEARAVAAVRLPDAVRQAQAGASDRDLEPPPRVVVSVRSSTEIVAVAEALDSAQATAYFLATEQARLRRSTSESLANLGRRNQNLLRRQLGFITQLEREETDPEGLANLFELDHLATRMRRNAESLLVLVGESSPRTWSEPVPVADVLRAAISEVEDYRRVTLRRVDDAYVGGTFVAGLAHLIAELVENGLAFSPPDVDVEIQGRQLPGRYLIGITDQGLGMDPSDMDRANARLRGAESFLTAPTRYLGHYVVGHLAQQMGVDVQLASSPVTGVAARVTLPSAVLVTPQPLGAGSPALAIGGVLSLKYVNDAGETIDASQPGRSAAGAPPPVSGSTGPDARTGPVWPPLAASKMDGFVTGVAHGRGETTRNGLLKRVPGPRRTGPANSSNGAVAMEPTLGYAAHVRDTLSSLRAGVARGAQDHAHRKQPQPSPSMREPEAEEGSRAH